RARVDVVAPIGARRTLHDRLRPETLLLAGPRERQGRRVVASAPDPRAEDHVRERLGRPVGVGELLQGQGKRPGRLRVASELDEFLRQLEQKQLGGRPPRQPNPWAPPLPAPPPLTSPLPPLPPPAP